MKYKILTLRPVHQQEWLSLAVCSLLSYLPIVSCIATALPINFAGVAVLCGLLTVLVILIAFFSLNGKIKREPLISLLGFLCLYAVHYAVFADNRQFMFTGFFDILGNPLYYLLFFNLTAYFFVRHINNYSIFFSVLQKFSYLIILCSALIMAYKAFRGEHIEYLSFSYNLLPFICVFTVSYFETNNKMNLVFAVMGFFLIFLSGSRGPLVCLLAVVATYFIFSSKSIRFKLLTLALLGAGAFVVWLFWEEILVLLINTASKYGLSIRIIDALRYNQFFFDNGRYDIASRLFEALEQASILGLGLFGDRAAVGSYAHNLFLEFLVDGGYIFGTCIIIINLFLLIRGLVASDDLLKINIITFLSVGLFKLLFSGSYLNQEPGFYILLGFLINALKDTKKQLPCNALEQGESSATNK